MAQTTAYGELANRLRAEIADGLYVGGRQLPTEAELASRYALSRQTVRRALQELVNEGLVYRVRGRGTFTTSLSPRLHYVHSVGSIEDLMELAVDTTRETIVPLEIRTDIEVAGRLHLAADLVMLGLFLRRYDDQPFCVVDVACPPMIGRRLVDQGVLARSGENSSRTVISVLDGLLPDGIGGAHQSVTAVGAPERVAGYIGCLPDAPVLRIDRLYVDVQGRPVYLAVNHFNPARYSYRVQLRRSQSPRSASAQRDG